MKQTDTASGLLDDAALRHSKEADVEIVQPPTLRPAHALCGPVGIREFALLVHRHPCKPVVRRVPQDHENRGLLLHSLRPVALLLEFREEQALLLLLFPSR